MPKTLCPYQTNKFSRFPRFCNRLRRKKKQGALLFFGWSCCVSAERGALERKRGTECRSAFVHGKSYTTQRTQGLNCASSYNKAEVRKHVSNKKKTCAQHSHCTPFVSACREVTAVCGLQAFGQSGTATKPKLLQSRKARIVKKTQKHTCDVKLGRMHRAR